MTTITPTQAHPAQRTHSTALSFGGVLRSEWIKLRSLRSTIWSYLIVVALSLGMALIMSLSMTSNMGDGPQPSADDQVGMLVQTATFGVFFGQLVVAVLGVLVISGEYTTGMIRSTLTAVPRRLPALAAKAIVLFAVTFVVGLIATLAAATLGAIVYSAADLQPNLLHPDVLLPALGAALYLALLSVFALGVGTILRSSAGGIATVVGILLVLPTVLQMIPADWASDISPYLLSAAGINMFGQMSFTDAISEFWENLLIVLGWVGASIAGAAVLLKRRDA